MIVAINVKKEHIEKGVQANCEGCPIFHAVSEVLTHDARCQVNTQTVFFIGGKCPTIPLPVEARQFINRFDTWKKPVDRDVLLERLHREFRPFIFMLDIPKQLLNIQSIRENKNATK